MSTHWEWMREIRLSNLMPSFSSLVASKDALPPTSSALPKSGSLSTSFLCVKSTLVKFHSLDTLEWDQSYRNIWLVQIGRQNLEGGMREAENCAFQVLKLCLQDLSFKLNLEWGLISNLWRISDSQWEEISSLAGIEATSVPNADEGDWRQLRKQ